MSNEQAVTTIVTSTPLDLLVASWLHAKFQKSGSERTLAAYRETIEQFRAALRQVNLDLDSQSHDDVTNVARIAQAFASYSRRGRQVAPATINARLAALASFYQYAIRQGALEHNPIDRVERAKVQAYANAQALTSARVRASLSAIDRATLAGKRDYALLAVLLQTGRRAAEVEALEVRDLAVEAGRVTLTFRRCKGNKVMRDTLPASASACLLDWLHAAYGYDLALGTREDTRPVWHRLRGRGRGQAIGSQTIADICSKRLGASNVHITRHTFAHLMETAGASANTIRERLGHSSLSTTTLYLGQLASASNPYADKLALAFGIEEK